MEKKGLCGTCMHVKACIFLKIPPIWECEEFSTDSNEQKNFKPVKSRQSSISEEIIIEN